LRPGRNAALALLGVAMLGSAVLLLVYGSGLAPFQDSWEFLMNRREFTLDAFMAPHNEHIVVIPVAIEQVLLRLFGMGSTTPEFVALVVSVLAAAALVFVYVRRRLGPWPALMAAIVLLFLGPAWQDLLWPFEIGFVGSVAFGVAMLLALERDDRRGDIVACVCAAVSIGFSSLGVAFAVGAAVDVLQKRRSRGWRRTYVAAVPLLLYAAWYAGWGHDAQGHISLHNVLVSPAYVFEGLSASVDSALALATIAGEAVGRSTWGPVVLVALVLLTAYAKLRKPGFSPRLWPVLAAAATFWFLAAFNAFPGREAYQSRYLFAGVTFVLLIAAGLLDGARPGNRALLAAGAVTLVVAGFNLTPLREGRDFLREQTTLTRSDLAAIEIARRTVDPAFELTPEVAGTSFLPEIRAGEYLRAVDEYGSPAYTPAELADADEAGRVQADVVLANALPVTIAAGANIRGQGSPRERCATLGGRAWPNALPMSLSPGTTMVALATGDAGTLRLRRFASGAYPLETALAGGSVTRLRIPRDTAARSWLLQVEAQQPATVCR
jgi:hypothetical protein